MWRECEYYILVMEKSIIEGLLFRIVRKYIERVVIIIVVFVEGYYLGMRR